MSTLKDSFFVTHTCVCRMQERNPSLFNRLLDICHQNDRTDHDDTDPAPIPARSSRTPEADYDNDSTSSTTLLCETFEDAEHSDSSESSSFGVSVALIASRCFTNECGEWARFDGLGKSFNYKATVVEKPMLVLSDENRRPRPQL